MMVSVQAHHKGVAGTSQEGFDPIADLKECGALYEELEICLAENNRDFSKCSHVTKAIRMCMMEKHQREKAERQANFVATVEKRMTE